MSQFTHLHVASAFSGHYGVTRPEHLAEAVQAMGGTALAITDRNGLYGAVKHIGACLQLGLDPIVGVDLAILDSDAKPVGRAVVLAHGHDRGAGWATLCKLVSVAHKHGKKQPVGLTIEQLAQLVQSGSEETGYVATATVLLSPDNPFGRLALGASRDSALHALQEWSQHFVAHGALAVEIVSWLTQPGAEWSTTQAQRLLDLAETLGIPAVLTNAVRYLSPDDALTADVLDAARHLEPLGMFQPQPNAQAWLKPHQAMVDHAMEICRDYRRAQKLLDATAALANRCRLEPVSDCGWGKPKTPEKATLGIDGNPFELLWQRAHEGIHWRYPNISQAKLQQVQHRLAQELMTIHKLEFATYFLTVADVAQMIRDMKIRTAARGSGAGSLVNYTLGISGVDPIENDLLFERFLSTERSSLPDIDIDVESARRHEIYRAIFKRYGSNRVTLLSMQSTYRGRGAVRDSGLALGLEEDRIDEIAKNVWRFSARSFRAATSKKPELAGLAQELETDRTMNLLVDITERLDRLPRHISMHPCGVILGDATLLNLTPVEPSGIELPMSQFDKDDMDPMGLLKLDVLGVRMQSSMAYAVQEIQRVSGKTLDLDAIPLDDPETFRTIRTTNTLGIFQIESPGQRELTGKHQPTVFNDLTIQISLFRPGPMKGNMIAPYLDGRHGFAKAHYPHPDLEPILRETFGVVIFHEHVLRIFNQMTKCGLAKADELRRSMEDPRKKPLIEKFFREKSAEHGYSASVIEEVWGTLEGFSSFGFCKAHGAAFAMPTYQSAWLKTHYPTEFVAGLFTHDPGMYPRRLLLAEARRLGVQILPLDVNKSTDEYRVEALPDGSLAVRLALTEIQNVSQNEIKRIIKNAPFKDLGDFYLRAEPSRRTLENLGLLGALDGVSGVTAESISAIVDSDSLKATRGDVMAKVRQLNAVSKRPKLDPSQPTLDFIDLTETMPRGNPAPSVEENVVNELKLMKLDVTQHVIELYREMLDEMGVVRSDELVGLRNRTEVLVAGVRVATQTPPMRSGKRVVFISLDDGAGCSDATFFDEAQQRCSHVLFNTRLVLVAGKTRRTGVRGVSIMAENAWDLKDLYKEWRKRKEQTGTGQQTMPEAQLQSA
ncbi:MAG: DNA polymerase III subunit alpha [Actinomycetales bacterium]|nr:DNA polymerase III subunit alpha [Actinomycetales bacterium]